MKIISGGQTGVDRAGLDAALEKGIECGGWCPEGGEAEDGAIPDKYPIKVLPGAGYGQRTKRNVLDSDGTIIIYFSYATGGTELTINFCIKEHKPYVLIDANEISIDRAAQKILEFVKDKNVLNIAGPRAGGEPRAYDYAKSVMILVLESVK